MARPIDGILLVDKAEGESSHGVVKKVRKFARKAGHAGTLDPFATGLLIVLLGQGTKLSHFLMSEDKTYLATMTLGVETDTFDPTGRVTNTEGVPQLEMVQIQRGAEEFVGEIEQTPPPFSALKVKGQRAYKLARKGQEVHLEKRKVTIHSIRVLSLNLPDVTMEVRCSKGTYVRSLAAELGRRLGPGGHLKRLRRLTAGRWEVEDALVSREIPEIDFHAFEDKVIPLKAALPDMEEVGAPDSLVGKIRNGYQPSWEELGQDGPPLDRDAKVVKLVNGEELLALADVTPGKGSERRLKVRRVFF